MMAYDWPPFTMLSDNIARYPEPTLTRPSIECAGNVHVFACEHAKSCQCGETRRAKKR